MKVFLIAILFLMPLIGKTDQGVEIRTQQTLEMLNQALATRSYDNLPSEIKENVLQHVLTALRTIRGDIIRPMPTVPSVPVMTITDVPELSFGVKSVAIVESTLLVFHTLDRGQIFQECLLGLARVNRIDSILLSSGNQKAKYLFSGYSAIWFKQDACEMIANQFELSSQLVLKPMTVRGSIGSVPFNFAGETNADILEQCHAAAKYNPMKHATYSISLSINQGNVKRLYNSSGYWRGEAEICKQILEQI
jgi:hypothetical protein